MRKNRKQMIGKAKIGGGFELLDQVKFNMLSIDFNSNCDGHVYTCMVFFSISCENHKTIGLEICCQPTDGHMEVSLPTNAIFLGRQAAQK